MHDGYSTLRQRPRYPGGLYEPVRRRSMARHHRRRRWGGVLAVLGGLAVLAALAIVAGPGAVTKPAHPHSLAPARSYLGRIAALAGQGPQSLAAQEVAAENAGIDRTLAYTPYVRVAGAQHREIALTFDDGPGPYTPRVLSILEHEHVPGTFFEVGVLERYFHASTTRIVADHFVIGDHTELHAPMSHLSASEQETQLLEQTSVIGKYGATFPRLFRPPYGLFNATTLSLLHHYRMLMVLWTVDTSDYRLPGVESIIHSAVAGARPGAIILLHDAGGNRAETVAALPRIIADLRARGYQLVTIPRLLLDNPPPANQNLAALPPGGG